MTFELTSKKDITCRKKSTKKSLAHGRDFKPNFSVNKISQCIVNLVQLLTTKGKYREITPKNFIRGINQRHFLIQDTKQ